MEKARPIRWLGEQTDRPGQAHKAAAGDRSIVGACLMKPPSPRSGRSALATDVQAFVIAVQVTKSLWAKWFRLSWRSVEAACRWPQPRPGCPAQRFGQPLAAIWRERGRDRDDTRASRRGTSPSPRPDIGAATVGVRPPGRRHVDLIPFW